MAALEMTAYRWLLDFVRPYWRGLTFVFLLSLLATALGLAQPYLTKILIDNGLIAGDFDTVLLVALALIAAAAIAMVLGAANRWLYVGVSGRILFDMRETVYAHLQTLSPDFFARRGQGDLMARLDGDIAEVQRFSTDFMLALVGGVIALSGSLAIMFALDWRLALLALVFLPAQMIFLRYMRPKVEVQTRLLRERAGQITGFLIERLSNMKLVQSSNAQGRESERLSDLNDQYLDELRRLQMTNFFATGVPNFMTSLSVALIFIVGGAYVIDAQSTVGTLIAFSAYMARATGPLQTLLGLYVAFHRAGVSLARIRELTAVGPETRSPAQPSEPEHWRGHVRFDGVTFNYPHGEAPAVKHIDLEIAAGTKTAIIGASGSGKSTLVDLLLRFYDPQEGKITIDGIDLRDMELDTLREHIAVVGQDIMLLNESIRRNIIYGIDEPGDERINGAVEQAQLSATIGQLPEGLETVIGERGATLSGGERQRITIARALLRDPCLLILDEATSALDTETEAAILKDVDRLFGSRTRIVISHRRQTTEGANAVYVMEAGSLAPLPAEQR